MTKVLSMFGSTDFENNASEKNNPSPKRNCMDISLGLQYPGEHKSNFCYNLQTRYFSLNKGGSSDPKGKYNCVCSSGRDAQEQGTHMSSLAATHLAPLSSQG